MGVGGVNAQDIIVLKNGELIKSKVIEISLSTMEYKRFDQENGPTYTINKSEVFAIHYADGSKDLFGNVNQLSAQIVVMKNCYSTQCVMILWNIL
jgi:hypothetical protein